MSDLFEGLTPSAPFRFFAEISAIPRPSSHEGAIADYIEAFAAARGLWYYRDAANNLLVKKPASADRIGAPTVLLQAHTDMVAEKNEGTVHDFLTDGLRLCREGDLLFAKGTTLGADDGFGVAYMLAVLDDSSLSHPPLECLFTTEEEIGMGGADVFDYSLISAAYMLNLDSAEEDTVIVGCCGGIRSQVTLPVTTMPVEEIGVRVAISGLCGGHSGEDIHRGRGNALSLLGRVLAALDKRYAFRLAEITGGDKTNAIPRECTALLYTADRKALTAELPLIFAAEKARLTAPEDSDAALSVSTEPVSFAMGKEDTARVLAFLALRSGVLQMRSEPPVMPAVSRNLANVRTGVGEIVFGLSSRAIEVTARDNAAGEIEALAIALGGRCTHYNPYQGWEEPFHGKLVADWRRAYRSVTGRESTPTLIHAGLETGVITAAVKGLSAIAVGCNIHDLHTPRERMELSSFADVYKTVLEFLRIV